jgi:hypothetical protein
LNKTVTGYCGAQKIIDMDKTMPLTYFCEGLDEVVQLR